MTPQHSTLTLAAFYVDGRRREITVRHRTVFVAGSAWLAWIVSVACMPNLPWVNIATGLLALTVVLVVLLGVGPARDRRALQRQRDAALVARADAAYTWWLMTGEHVAVAPMAVSNGAYLVQPDGQRISLQQ